MNDDNKVIIDQQILDAILSAGNDIATRINEANRPDDVKHILTYFNAYKNLIQNKKLTNMYDINYAYARLHNMNFFYDSNNITRMHLKNYNENTNFDIIQIIHLLGKLINISEANTFYDIVQQVIAIKYTDFELTLDIDIDGANINNIINFLSNLKSYPLYVMDMPEFKQYKNIIVELSDYCSKYNDAISHCVADNKDNKVLSENIINKINIIINNTDKVIIDYITEISDNINVANYTFDSCNLLYKLFEKIRNDYIKNIILSENIIYSDNEIIAEILNKIYNILQQQYIHTILIINKNIKSEADGMFEMIKNNVTPYVYCKIFDFYCVHNHNIFTNFRDNILNIFINILDESTTIITLKNNEYDVNFIHNTGQKKTSEDIVKKNIYDNIKMLIVKQNNNDPYIIILYVPYYYIQKIINNLYNEIYVNTILILSGEKYAIKSIDGDKNNSIITYLNLDNKFINIIINSLIDLFTYCIKNEIVYIKYDADKKPTEINTIYTIFPLLEQLFNKMIVFDKNEVKTFIINILTLKIYKPHATYIVSKHISNVAELLNNYYYNAIPGGYTVNLIDAFTKKITDIKNVPVKKKLLTEIYDTFLSLGTAVQIGKRPDKADKDGEFLKNYKGSATNIYNFLSDAENIESITGYNKDAIVSKNNDIQNMPMPGAKV